MNNNFLHIMCSSKNKINNTNHIAPATHRSNKILLANIFENRTCALKEPPTARLHLPKNPGPGKTITTHHTILLLIVV